MGWWLIIFGPLLNIPIGYAIYSLAKPFSIRFANPAAAALLAPVIGLALFHAALVVPGYLKFRSICTAHGSPVIHERIRVSSIYVDEIPGYQAYEYLRCGSDFCVANRTALHPPFQTIETSNSERRTGAIRYVNDPNGKARTEQIPRLSDGTYDFQAKYGVRKKFVDYGWTTRGFETTVYERATGRELGHARRLSFDGGYLQFLRFTLGSAHCPSIESGQSDDDSLTAGNLPAIILGGRPLGRIKGQWPE